MEAKSHLRNVSSVCALVVLFSWISLALWFVEARSQPDYFIALNGAALWSIVLGISILAALLPFDITGRYTGARYWEVRCFCAVAVITLSSYMAMNVADAGKFSAPIIVSLVQLFLLISIVIAVHKRLGTIAAAILSTILLLPYIGYFILGAHPYYSLHGLIWLDRNILISTFGAVTPIILFLLGAILDRTAAGPIAERFVFSRIAKSLNVPIEDAIPYCFRGRLLAWTLATIGMLTPENLPLKLFAIYAFSSEMKAFSEALTFVSLFKVLAGPRFFLICLLIILCVFFGRRDNLTSRVISFICGLFAVVLSPILACCALLIAAPRLAIKKLNRNPQSVGNHSYWIQALLVFFTVCAMGTISEITSRWIAPTVIYLSQQDLEIVGAVAASFLFIFFLGVTRNWTTETISETSIWQRALGFITVLLMLAYLAIAPTLHAFTILASISIIFQITLSYLKRLNVLTNMGEYATFLAGLTGPMAAISLIVISYITALAVINNSGWQSILGFGF